MGMLQIILLLIVAFVSGVGSVADEWQTHRPLIACTLIGLVLGDIQTGIIIGGTLELLALGWMNIGAAMAPDAALASVVSTILVIKSGLSVTDGIAIAIPLAAAGQVLTIFVRTIVVIFVHKADKYAEQGNIKGVELMHYLGMSMQGLRIVIPTAIVLMVSPEAVNAVLNSIPEVITRGLQVGGGMVVVVGYAMVINMISSPYLMVFLFLGTIFAAFSELTLIQLGIAGIAIAVIYLQLSPKYNRSANVAAINSENGDEFEAELEDL